MTGAAHTPLGAWRGLGFAALLLLGGCMVGPKYEPPNVTTLTMDDWQDLDDPLLSDQPLTDPKWWSSAFNDPVLDTLVEAALAQNLSLRAAALRILQAQQNLAIAMGNQYPQQQALYGGAEVKQLSQNATDQLQLLDNDYATYSLGFKLAWELDFWGKYRRMVHQAAAQLDASVSDYDDAMVSLIAEVAQNYLMVRTFQKKLAISHENVALQTRAVDITRARYELGEIGEMPLDVFRLMLYNTKAGEFGIEQSLQQTKNALALLLGRLPGEIDSLLADTTGIPTPPPQIAVGMPQNLIRRRPDLRAAERLLAAQAAEVGIAVTDLYPQLTIGGGIGTSTNSTSGKGLGELFNSESLSFNLFGIFQWNIFNYGRIKSNVRLQDAAFQAQLEEYRNMVLEVQGEVANAIVAYLKSHQQAESYLVSAENAQRAADIAFIQYQDGATDYVPLWMNLWFLYIQQSTLVSVEGSVATNLVQVYKSLGGGWEVRDGQDPVDLLPESTKDEMRQRLSAWNKVLN